MEGRLEPATRVSFVGVTGKGQLDEPLDEGVWKGTRAEGVPSGSQPVRVLIVDDHRSFGDSLGLAIDMQPDLGCVGIAETAQEAIDVVATDCPDVVLMDVRLPDADGIDATRTMKEVCANAAFLIMTAYSDLELLSRAAAAGASGFLPKESPIADFFDAIRTAGVGGMIVDRATLVAIIDRVRASSPGGAASGTDARLTPRELEVLTLMGQGTDARGISQQLGIRLSTCRGYQKSILFKLGVHSQLEAVVSAVRMGILPPLSV